MTSIYESTVSMAALLEPPHNGVLKYFASEDQYFIELPAITEPNIENINLLISVLETVEMETSRLRGEIENPAYDDVTFDLSSWYSDPDNLKNLSNKDLPESIRILFDCGTTCCALGWAALDQRLIKKGLKVDDGIPTMFLPEDSEEGYETTSYIGFEAGAALLNISGPASSVLFNDYHYTSHSGTPTPRDVIERLRKVKRKEPLQYAIRDLDGEVLSERYPLTMIK